MNNIIKVGEHIYRLPDAPKSKADVLFVDEKKENQYWRRQKDFPQIFFDYIPGFTKVNAGATIYNSSQKLITLSEQDTRELIRLRDRELMRRQHGVFLMINGVLTYITGNHYNALQWGAWHGYTNEEQDHPDYGENFGMYREFQRDFFYFIDIVETDPNCAGGFIAKAKKTGITQLMALVYQNESTMIRQKRFTMMSKSHDDCKGTNMMFFQHALEKYPLIMKPKIKNINQSKVVFDKPRATISGSAKQLMDSQIKDGFKTFVEALPLKADAMDGPKIWRAWNDEFPKYDNPYPQDVFDKSKEATKLQHQIVGKQFYTSYPPEEDKRGFFEAKKIYFESALAEMNAMNQTKSGLYKYFISALLSTEGTFDWYGKADIEKARYQNSVRRNVTDRRELQTLKRQYPETEKEAWESGGAGSTFDNIRLSQQEVDVIEEEKAGAMHFTEGFLDWSNGYKSPVFFTELTTQQRIAEKKGNWRIYKKLLRSELNVPFNLERDDYERFQPDPNTEMAAGVDPTDYKEKKDVQQGSKNAIVVGNSPNIIKNTEFNKVVTNILVAEYFDRPDDPDEFYEELVKAILFLGMYVLVEANKGWVVTRLKKDGLQNFLLVKDRKNRTIRPFREGDELVLVNTTEVMIDEYCRAIARWIRKPAMQDEIDYLKLLVSLRVIRQLMDFDPEKTKVFDLVVATGYMRLAIEALAVVKAQRQSELSMYDNGMVESLVDALLDL